MKNNFTFFAAWFPTLLISSCVSALISGVLQMAFKFIFSDAYWLQNLAVWLILTVIISASLAAQSSRLGEELNRTSKEFSTGIPVFNMLAGAAIYVCLYVLLNGRALGILHLFPAEMFMNNSIFGRDGAPLIQKIPLCVLQITIYTAVSLAFYLAAKKKQENSEGIKRLRGEKKKSTNRFGIDIDI